MAQELPYFRFTVQEWQNGEINFETYDMKGVFIDVCGYYWISDCSMTLAMLKKRLRDATEYLMALIDLGAIKHDSKTDEININFLDKQFDLLSNKRKKRAEAGRLGGLSKSSNAKAMLKQNPSYKDKDKDKDKDKSINPTLKEVQDFFVENNYMKEAGTKAYNFYNDNNWCNSKDKPVKNWKSTMRNNWFKKENEAINHPQRFKLPM